MTDLAVPAATASELVAPDLSPLAPLFAPRGIVLVGASRTPGKLGTAMTEALAEADAAVALVNTRDGEGMHASISDAAAALAARGAAADLVVSCVPASATAAVLTDAGAAGVRAALVCAGGFAEIGDDGRAAQRDTEAAARTSGIRVLGPNTSGFFVPSRRLRASFVPGAAALQPGCIAVIASSGGVNHMLSFRLAAAGAGVSLGVGIGGGMGVSHADVVRHAATDPSTTAIALHLESVDDGVDLLDAVRHAVSVKPVIALVVGRRTESAFAQSHTGALATGWRTTRSVLAQAGAVVVDDEDALVAASIALSRLRLPAAVSPGVALVTAQAGPGLIIDDHATAQGWNLPRLHAHTRERLGTLLPPLTFQENPVDTGRPGQTFPDVLRTVGADDQVDIIAVYALSEPVVDLPAAIAQAAPAVPVIVAIDGPRADIDAAVHSAAPAGIPIVTGPRALAGAVTAVVADSRARALASDTPVDRPAVVIETGGAWDEVRAKEVLDAVGIATPPRRRVNDLAAAQRALLELDGSLAVKMIDASVLHKTEAGGVRLGVRTPDELSDALADVARTGAREFLVERMAPDGVDLVVSVRRDPVFGPIALLGLGGTAAEAYADVAIRTAGFGAATVTSMVDELRAGALLRGWRGGPSLDDAELAQVFAGLAAVLASAPALQEVELNPLRLTADGLVALDAVVVDTLAGTTRP